MKWVVISLIIMALGQPGFAQDDLMYTGTMIKLDISPDEVLVSLDGNELGRVENVENLSLTPGEHVLEFKHPLCPSQIKRIRVLTEAEWSSQTVDGQTITVPKRWKKYDKKLEIDQKVTCQAAKDAEEAREKMEEEMEDMEIDEDWLAKIHASFVPLEDQNAMSLTTKHSFETCWKSVAQALFDSGESVAMMDAASGLITTKERVLDLKISLSAKAAYHTLSIAVISGNGATTIKVKRNLTMGRAGLFGGSGGSIYSDGYYEKQLLDFVRKYLP